MAMKPTRKPERVTGVEGLKMAISAAALAATVGGWGWLTAQQPPEIAATEPLIVVEQPLIERQSAPQWLQQSPPVPVVPTVRPLTIPNRDAGTTAPAAAPAPAPAAAPAPAPAAAPAPAPAAAPAPAPAPALREVTLPAPRPVPAARTRSSR